MLTISIATSCSLISLHIFKKGSYGKPVPALIKLIFFDYIAKIFFIENNIKMKSKVKMKKHFDLGIKSSENINRLTAYNTNNAASSLKVSNSKNLESNNISTGNEVKRDEIWNDFVIKGIVNEQKKISKLIKTLNKHLDEQELRDELDDYYEKIQSEWSQLSQIVDFFFAFIFISFGMIVMLLFIYFYVTI